MYANAQQYDTLNNKAIIQLTKIGLPPQTIINKIQTSYTSFDVSINALVELQNNNVNGDVINEMIKRKDEANVLAVREVNSDNPNVMHRPGVYYYNSENTGDLLRRVDPTVVSSNQSGGFGQSIAFKYSGGTSKVKAKSSLATSNSRLQINATNPVFYFYFENNANPRADSWFFATATSPNEFVCVKLAKKKDSREMEIGAVSAYGKHTGIPNKVKMPFDYEEVSEGIYKVTFSKPLVKGEYCFIYASETPSRYSNDKVFDFGIRDSK